MEKNLLQERLENANVKLVKANARLNKWLVKVDPANKHLIGANRDARAHLSFDQQNVLSEVYTAQLIVNDATALVAKYNAQLQNAKETEYDFNDAPAIVEFLNAWEKRAKEFYTQQIAEYKTKSSNLGDYLQNRIAHKELSKQYSHVIDYVNGWKNLDKDLASEKQRKAKNLIARIREIVGKVTDAKGLYIANDMEINGIVIGEQGKAKVETITAGGYNIQCLHFRVLVHAMQ